jgi:hypothetical protein
VRHREFAEPLAQIRAVAEVCVADSIEGFLGRLRNRSDRYDLALGCASRPGQLPGTVGRRLIRAAPLVGRAVLLGTWGEGQQRTGDPWPDCEHLFWHQFATWWNTNLALRQSGRRCTWHRQLGDSTKPPIALPASRQGVVVVDAADHESQATMTAALERAGLAAVDFRKIFRTGQPWPHPVPLRGGVWIGSQLVASQRDRFARFARAIGAGNDTSLVGVVDFPRYDDAQFAATLGGRLVGKPWRYDELVAAVVGPNTTLVGGTTQSTTFVSTTAPGDGLGVDHPL